MRVMVVIVSGCVSLTLTLTLTLTTLAATYLVYMSKIRLHTVSCRLLKICIVWAYTENVSFGIHCIAMIIGNSALSR